MRAEDIASRCITGGCEYLDIQGKLMAHREEINLIILAGLIFLIIVAIWVIGKDNIKRNEKV